MIKLFSAVGIALLCCKIASAQSVFTVGIGNESCASWTMNKSSDFEVGTWIEGYLSGANFPNSNHLVGHSTDIYGLVGAVQQICELAPSNSIADAAGVAYLKLQQAGQ